MSQVSQIFGHHGFPGHHGRHGMRGHHGHHGPEGHHGHHGPHGHGHGGHHGLGHGGHGHGGPHGHGGHHGFGKFGKFGRKGMMPDMEGKCGRKFKKWSSDNEESDACDKWSRKGKIGKWSKLGQSTKTSGGKFKAYVRLMGYQAEGLEIKAAEGWLTVTGKHDETSEDGNEQVSRNFTKKFKIPADAKVDEIRTKLVKHGRFLKVIVPLNNAGQDIPVTIVPSAPSENEAMERLVI